MPEDLEHAESRTLVAKTFLEMLRRLSVAYLGNPHLGAACGDLLICIAIFISQAEGKPTTAHKLAAYVGMPRPTVARRMRAMCKLGLIEMRSGLAYLPAEKINNQLMLQAHRSSITETKLLAAKLDTLDV